MTAPTPRTCSDCPAPIGRSSKTGRCRTCALRVSMADPAIAEKRLNALRAAQRDPSKALSRSMGARRGMAKRMANPEHREALSRVMREKIRPKADAPEAKAKRDYAALGRKLQARWLAWCPEELRDDYQHLRRTKGMGAEAAKAIILEQAAKLQRRAETFEEKLARVQAGAPITTAVYAPFRPSSDVVREMERAKGERA